MSTVNTTGKSYHGTGGGWVNSGTIYVGLDVKTQIPYRTKIQFTTPSFSGGSTKVTLKFSLSWGNFWPGNTRCFLSKQNTSSSDSTYISAGQVIETSYLYDDINKSSRAKSSRNRTSPIYIVFNSKNILPNTTYYVYIYPYGTDYKENATNINSTKYKEIWFQSSNTVYVDIYYDKPPDPPPPPPAPKGYAPFIYDNGTWKECIPYVYNNGSWKECNLKIYNGNSWD